MQRRRPSGAGATTRSGRADAEARALVAGQVAAPRARVLGHVLAVLEHLERRAHRGRVAQVRVARLVEHAQHELADRLGESRQ
jgi:hypothetical protein